ncbi:flavin reductase family protein [Curtobacterium flaccumfaciens]|uniref:flavin reductase family protein n=1 Tax=Curtobacterium flaccumfaciens TaxID=2035 RepID=UPI00387926D0
MGALSDSFKEAFRGHPAGVAIITAATPEGPAGLTASSVSSVSVDPVSLSFSVTHTSGSAGKLLAAATIAVHLLGDGQAEIAEAFARPGAPRFTSEQGWSQLPSGEPFLPDARVVFRARPDQQVRVGESVLVIAEVLSVYVGSTSGPLLYCDRQFATLGPVVDV